MNRILTEVDFTTAFEYYYRVSLLKFVVRYKNHIP